MRRLARTAIGVKETVWPAIFAFPSFSSNSQEFAASGFHSIFASSRS